MNKVNLNFKKHANFIPQHHSLMRVLEGDSLTYIDSGFKSDTFNIIHIEDKNFTAESLKEGLSFIDNRLRVPCVWIDGADITDKGLEVFDTLDMVRNDSSVMLSLDIKETTEYKPSSKISRTKQKQDIIDHAFVIANNWDPFDVEVLHYYNRASEFLLDQNNSLMFNYFDGEATVGVIELFIEPDQPTTAGIYNLSVLKENRKQGIGFQLIQHALYTAQALGVNNVVAHASDDSVRLFEKLEFVKEGEIVEFGKK
ncbi:GNAT family N-acetyltransferase [Flammeovirga sp. MY04]|uniref:GNAT family N-acetyltransferase n=1 Tax=Flammeovirga sp. MY04 TaxID=1191459 RepID=UPI0008061B7D|nr:GNAT family N-acetyltransferase [Flammeovirga sp. MY04]ANQ52668.1 GNAT family N-acetyltransferase [Flammeovirga sp. MY04]